MPASLSILDLKLSGIRKIMIFLMILSVFVQIEVYGGEEGASLCLYHILMPLTFLLLFHFPVFRKSIILYVLFFTVLGLSSLYGWMTHGLFLRALYLPITVLAFVTGIMIPGKINYDGLKKIFVLVAWTVLIILCIRFLFYFDNYLSAWGGNKRSAFDVPFLASGGGKAENSNIALMTFLVIGVTAYVPLITTVLMLAMSYHARGAFLVIVLSIVASLFLHKSARLVLFSLLLIAGVFLLGTVYFTFSPDTKNVFTRYLQINDEVASQSVDVRGRMGYYQTAQAVVKKHPIGVGVGNSMTAVRQEIDFMFHNNNLHNIYLTYMVEGGYLSVILYLLIVFKIAYEQIRCGFRNRIGLFLCGYFILGMFQYIAYDAFAWLFMGMYESAQAVYDRKKMLE